MIPQASDPIDFSGGKAGRFVVLRHECGPANGGAGASPWDLMVEIPGQEKLVSWQVRTPPEFWSARIAAKRIQDHRRQYLTYEGVISGDRGSVKRVEEGTAHVLGGMEIGPPWVLRLEGKTLSGEYVVG